MDAAGFFSALCGRFGWEPTPWRLAVFAQWAHDEGMPFDRTFNPLATTRQSPRTALDLTYDNGNGPGNWNSVPVRVYASAADGIQATYETLMLDYYPNVRRCFADQEGYGEAVPELTTYIGSPGYAQSLVLFMQQTTAARVMAPAVNPSAVTVADVVKATYGTGDRMRELLANNAALEARLSHLEAADGPIGLLAQHLGSQAGVPPAIVDALDALLKAVKANAAP